MLNGAIIKERRRIGGEKNPFCMEKQHVNKERMDPEGNYLHLLVSVFPKILLKCPTVAVQCPSAGEDRIGGTYWPFCLIENGLVSACLSA